MTEPQHDKTNKLTDVPSENSGEPGHLLSLIRVFIFRLKKPWVFSYPLSTQADLSLRWTHVSFCWFCHAVAFVYVTFCLICLVFGVARDIQVNMPFDGMVGFVSTNVLQRRPKWYRLHDFCVSFLSLYPLEALCLLTFMSKSKSTFVGKAYLNPFESF